jgi:uncharacterized membrane protein (Fun14 family)
VSLLVLLSARIADGFISGFRYDTAIFFILRVTVLVYGVGCLVMLPLNSVRFGVGILWNALCHDMTTYVGLREFFCTKSLNVKIVSIIPTMEIKVWKVCFFHTVFFF